MFWCGLPWVPCVQRSVHLHGLRYYLLPQVGEVFSNYLLKDTLPFTLSSSSGIPLIRMLFHLDWSHSSLNTLSFLEILLSCSSFRISCVNYIFILYVILGGGLCLTSHAAICKPILSVLWLLYTDVILTECRGQLLHG